MGPCKEMLEDHSACEQNFDEVESKNLVYVRPVFARDVMDELDSEEFQSEEPIPAETVLYALHAADGVRLALTGNRDLAFAVARQNEMMPVSVH